MGIVSKNHTFSAGATIIASEHNSNFDTIYNCVNGNISNANISNSAAIAYSKLSLTGSILNADINASAGIAATKLATISTAGKVSGAALTSLSSIPSGAGVIPIANLATGTPTGAKFVRDDGTLQISSSNQTSFSYSKSDGWSTASSSYTTVIPSYFLKVSGLGTLTVYVYIKKVDDTNPAKTASCQVTINSGGLSGSTTTTDNDNSYHWKSFTIDVSSLTAGNFYDLNIDIKQNSGADFSNIQTIIGFLS